MQTKIKNIKVIKWNGLKNSETGQTDSGYLWLDFLENVYLKNTDSNLICLYKKGQKSGFFIKALYRNHAIAVFERNYLNV
jgi:hypothetical protein